MKDNMLSAFFNSLSSFDALSHLILIINAHPDLRLDLTHFIEINTYILSSMPCKFVTHGITCIFAFMNEAQS